MTACEAPRRAGSVAWEWFRVPIEHRGWKPLADKPLIAKMIVGSTSLPRSPMIHRPGKPGTTKGVPFVKEAEATVGGRIDYAVSHAGENAFPRTFQMLGNNGVLAFYGASSGYRFTFMGKSGSSTPAKMFQRAGLRAGKTVLIVYGPGAQDGIVDNVAIEAIEVACQSGCQVAVLVDTIAQREFVSSLGFGPRVRGVVSIEEIAKRLGDDFVAPGPFPTMPDPFTQSEAFREAVREFSDKTLKPIGSAIAPALRNTLDKRGLPDVVFERRGRDGLALASALVKPNTGRVVYCEDLEGCRFSFYAPQVWTRQRRIIMPTAEIRGTHLNTSREFAEMQEQIASGFLAVLPPTPSADGRFTRGTSGYVGEQTSRRQLRRHPCAASCRIEIERRTLPGLGNS